MESALEPRTKSFRRCCSAPVLTSLAHPEEDEELNNENLEVYVVARPFQEFGGPIMKRLPEDYRGFAVHIGVCHFMTVFKTRDGRLIQFDFGPQGGRDVHANSGPLSWLLREESSQPVRKRKNNVQGEIREALLVELPTAHVYMGESRLSLADIRNFNGIQSTEYELHKHDCRHYVNNLVHYTTGVNGASVKFVKEYFKTQSENGPPLSSTFVGLLQNITDASNWSKVKATGKATVAAVLYLAGSGAARTRAAAQLPRRPVKRAAMTALASVAASCPEIPMVKGAAAFGSMVTEGAKKVTTGTASFVETAGRSVTRSVIPQRSNAAFAMASAVTRGAAGLVTGPFKRAPQHSGENIARLPWLGQSRRKIGRNPPPPSESVVS